MADHDDDANACSRHRDPSAGRPVMPPIDWVLRRPVGVALLNDVVNVMAVLREHGMLLASAKGPIPNVAELVVGEPIRGSWWAHPRGHEIFAVLNELADSPDVVRLRLVRDKITLVHRRLWPALVRLADEIPAAALAAIEEEHTASGAHRKVEIPFPDWVPPEVIGEAADLTVDEAREQLPAAVLER